MSLSVLNCLHKSHPIITTLQTGDLNINLLLMMSKLSQDGEVQGQAPFHKDVGNKVKIWTHDCLTPSTMFLSLCVLCHQCWNI